MVIVLPEERTAANRCLWEPGRGSQSVLSPTCLAVLRFPGTTRASGADLARTRGPLLPSCVGVQGMEVCHPPAHVSAPEVLGHRRAHLCVCVRVPVCSWCHSPSISYLQASWKNLVPLTSPACRRTRRRSPWAVSAGRGLCDFLVSR